MYSNMEVWSKHARMGVFVGRDGEENAVCEGMGGECSV